MPARSASRPDHVAGGVLQEHERRVGLVAQLDELRRLHGALGIDRAVVADDADRLAVDRRPARTRCATP